MTTDVHPIKAYRSVPTSRLTRRLGLHTFTGDAPFWPGELRPKSVAIPLQQHIGAPPVPVVAVGDKVAAGDVIAEPTDSQLSVSAHASIAGVVRQVGDVIVIESDA